MRKTTLLNLFLGTVLCGCAGSRHINSADIENYFTSVLSGENAKYENTKKIALDDIAETSELVWQIWADANKKFDEDKLPELTDLGGDYNTKPASGVWKLGQEDMQFIYGRKGEKPENGYPLFLSLHGSGDNTSEFRATLAWANLYDDAPSAYFIPRSPKGGTGCRWYQPTRQEAWERLMRQAFLSGDIDPLRIYFFGISEGAYGSQRLASFYADYLAGAGPIAGGEQMFWAPPENCASIAFCLQTGEFDTMFGRTLLTARANTQWDSLATLHPGYYEHKIDLQPGYGHGCNYRITTPYLKNFTRNAYPKYVRWENLALGNINGEGAAFRDGFYNLYIKERSTDDSDPYVRSSYEMTIDNNEIDLDVNVVTIIPDAPEKSKQGWEIIISETKKYEKATKGRIVIYLNDKLVDLSKPVVVRVNGVEKFNGKVTPRLSDIVNSCAEYFDPLRLYPASVEVTVE